MKKVMLFVMKGCPYCVSALRYLDKLKTDHPEYQAVEIDQIDENEQPDLSNRYDYWYVPTFYVDGKKMHEGVPTMEKVERVLKEALS